MEDPLLPPRSIGRSLNFATGATNALCARLLAPHGLSLAQWVVLSTLWRNDGATLSQLAQLAGQALPAMSRLVDRMEAAGLVGRAAGSDRRSLRIHLTEAGRALEHLADLPDRVNRLVMRGLSAAEQAALFDLLERAEVNARGASAEVG